MKIGKRIAAVGAAMVMAVSMMGVGTSAFTTKGTTTKSTSGGTAGTVVIRSRVYTDIYQPSGGVRVYQYGVMSDIKDSTTLKTAFNITGTLTTSSSSTPISASGTANSVKAYKSSGSTGAYNYCSSKTTTSSTAFGSSTQQCNYSLT